MTRKLLSPRWLLATAALVAVTSCGGSDSSSDDTTAADTTEVAAATTEVAETSPATTPETVPETTEAPTATTEPEPSGPELNTPEQLEGGWIVIRKVTEDDGYFGFQPQFPDPVEFRAYDVSCSDDACVDLSVVSTRVGLESSPPFTLTFDGTELSSTREDVYGCLNAEGTAYDGPAETASTSITSLEPVIVDGELTAFSGSYTVRETNPGSADCLAVDAGYTSEMTMFRPDRVESLPLEDGAWAGESDVLGAERGLTDCDADGCVMRQRLDQGTAGEPRPEQIDVTLSGDPDAGYSGTTTLFSSCNGDSTGAFVAERAYNTTLTVEAHAYEVPGIDGPVLVTHEQNSGEPVTTLTPEQLAECSAYEVALTFGGLVTDAPAVVDFDAPAANGPDAPSTDTTVAAGAFAGITDGQVTDAVAFADALGAAALPAFDPEYYGLQAAITTSGLAATVAPGDPATPDALSIGGPFDTADGRAIVGYAVSDGTTCALRAVVDDPSGPQFYAITAAAVDCNAYEALDAFNGGQATQVV